MSKKIKLLIEVDEEAYRARQHWVANPKRTIDEVDIAIANGTPITESKAKKKVKVTETEHCCVSCKFGNLYSDSEPCCNCTDDNDMFEPIESRS